MLRIAGLSESTSLLIFVSRFHPCFIGVSSVAKSFSGIQRAAGVLPAELRWLRIRAMTGERSSLAVRASMR